MPRKTGHTLRRLFTGGVYILSSQPKMRVSTNHLHRPQGGGRKPRTSYITTLPHPNTPGLMPRGKWGISPKFSRCTSIRAIGDIYTFAPKDGRRRPRKAYLSTLPHRNTRWWEIGESWRIAAKFPRGLAFAQYRICISAHRRGGKSESATQEIENAAGASRMLSDQGLIQTGGIAHRKLHWRKRNEQENFGACSSIVVPPMKAGSGHRAGINAPTLTPIAQKPNRREETVRRTARQNLKMARSAQRPRQSLHRPRKLPRTLRGGIAIKHCGRRQRRE